MKQAPRNWRLHFVKLFKSLGFVHSVLDNCLFILLADGELFFLTLHVDDILIRMTNPELLVELKDKFTNNFEMKNLGEVSQYLVIKITLEDGIIKVDQKQKMKDILKRFEVLTRDIDKRSYNTPMEQTL